MSLLIGLNLKTPQLNLDVGVPGSTEDLSLMRPHAAGFESGYFSGSCYNYVLTRLRAFSRTI
jgi:hypothetical protein